LLVEFAVLRFVLDDFALFYRRVAGIDDHVGLEVQNRFQIAQGKYRADARCGWADP